MLGFVGSALGGEKDIQGVFCWQKDGSRSATLSGPCALCSNLRCTSDSEGRLSRKRFMVRLGRCDGVESRGAKNPRRAVSIAAMELKLKEPLSIRWSEEKTGSSSQSDLLRLRTILISGTMPWW